MSRHRRDVRSLFDHEAISPGSEYLMNLHVPGRRDCHLSTVCCSKNSAVLLGTNEGSDSHLITFVATVQVSVSHAKQ